MAVIIFDIIFILFLVLANGILAMSEIAIVSARRARLEHDVEKGNAKARVALELIKSPGDFLSTVQIGITLAGILAGAFGGMTIAEYLKSYIRLLPWLAPFSESISLGLVVLAITYLSLVVGELVPKRLGLWKPEGIAAFIAKPMQNLSRLVRPAVWVLTVSTNLVLRIFGVAPNSEASMTEEEIKVLIKYAEQAGVFQKAEREMIGRVLHLGHRRVSSLMTPRPDMEWIDLNDLEETNRLKAATSVHSHLPVGQGRLNNFLGVITTKDLLVHGTDGKEFDIRSKLKQPLFVPETMKGLKVLEHFKKAKTQLALVLDEYGGITGLITLYDILQAIVGDIPSELETTEMAVVQREDGSWLVDGMLPACEFQDVLSSHNLFDDLSKYNTVAGFLLAKFGRIPSVGDYFEVADLRVEVVDMDGNRIDKVLVLPIKQKTASGSQ